jgi:glycosyltransferase involved in cell wall biosynthesis
VALYCDPHDEADVAERIVEVATNGEVRERLIQRGVQRARQYSWDTSAATALEMLEHAASSRR